MPELSTCSSTPAVDSQTEETRELTRELTVFQCERCFAAYIARPGLQARRIKATGWFCKVCGSRRVERIGVLELKV